MIRVVTPDTQPIRRISRFDWWISKGYFAQSLIQELLYNLPFMEYLHGINSCDLIHGIEPHWAVRNEALRYSCHSESCETRVGWSCSSGRGLDIGSTETDLQSDYSADLAEGWWLVLRQIVGTYTCCENVRWNELAHYSSHWRTLLVVTLDLGVLLQSGWYRRYCISAWRPCCSLSARLHLLRRLRCVIVVNSDGIHRGLEPWTAEIVCVPGALKLFVRP
jgi:hypothetical protein